MNWLKANWKALLLTASLALNLFGIGMVASHAWMERHGPGRITAAAWSQLLPRGFFMELPRERRRELLEGLKSRASIFRDGRAALRARAGELADALAAEPYDEARAKSALEAFSGEGKKLNDESISVALAVISSLSADERKRLADHIHRRARTPGKDGRGEE